MFFKEVIMMKRLYFILLMTMFIAITFIYSDCSYASLDDRSDRLSSEQSSVFSPGYINAAKQHTEEIIRQAYSNTNTLERNIDNMDNKLTNDVKEVATNKAVPELKKKTSSTGDPSQRVASNTQATVTANTADNNVRIGSGAEQTKTYDGSGRLLSEVINNTRYVYVGFNTVGLNNIKTAIDYADARGGGTVIIRGGSYNIDSSDSIINSIKIYGGYGEDGVRDLVNTPTTLEGTNYFDNITGSVELDGFIFNTPHSTGTGSINSMDPANLTIRNCTFNGAASDYGIAVAWIGFSGNGIGSLTLENNIFETSGLSSRVNSELQVSISATGNIFNGNTGLFTFGGMNGTSANLVSSGNNFTSSQGFLTRFGVTAHSSNDYFAGPNTFAGVTVTNPLSVPNIVGQQNTLQTTAASSGFQEIHFNNNITSAYLENNQLSYEDSLRNFHTLYTSLDTKTTKSLDSVAVYNMLKDSLAGKKFLSESAMGDKINQEMFIKFLEESSKQIGISVPPGDMADLAVRLENIIKNPTADQKEVLDAISVILKDMEKDQGQDGSPDIRKSSDDLLQAVANILIAQAIPDLLKEGDVSNIKNMFSELNTSKNKIMFDYNEAVRPYYQELKKLLSKNLSILQLSNLVSKQMLEEEIDKLQPNEIDKIFEKLRKASNKSFEEEYMLQQEAKYRKQYIDPNKKMLEDKMKVMMRDFTRKISTVLEGASAAKK